MQSFYKVIACLLIFISGNALAAARLYTLCSPIKPNSPSLRRVPKKGLEMSADELAQFFDANVRQELNNRVAVLKQHYAEADHNVTAYIKPDVYAVSQKFFCDLSQKISVLKVHTTPWITQHIAHIEAFLKLPLEQKGYIARALAEEFYSEYEQYF